MPSHKFLCQDAKMGATLKVINTLMDILCGELNLMSAFILTFRLHKRMILDRQLIVRCDLAIDAADLTIVFALIKGEQTPDGDYPSGVQGMIQVKSFELLDSDIAVDVGRPKIWEEARKTNHLLQSTGPIGKNATGLIDFHMGGTDQVITVPIKFYDQAIEAIIDTETLSKRPP